MLQSNNKMHSFLHVNCNSYVCDKSGDMVVMLKLFNINKNSHGLCKNKKKKLQIMPSIKLDVFYKKNVVRGLFF